MRSKCELSSRKRYTIVTLLALHVSALSLQAEMPADTARHLAFSTKSTEHNEGFNGGTMQFVSGDTLDVTVGVFADDGNSPAPVSSPTEARFTILDANGRAHPDLSIAAPQSLVLSTSSATMATKLVVRWTGKDTISALIQLRASGLTPAEVTVQIFPENPWGDLTLSITFIGNVFEDSNPDLEFTPDEQTIASALVVLSSNSGRVLASGMTDNEGFYAISCEADSTDFPCSLTLEPISGLYQWLPYPSPYSMHEIRNYSEALNFVLRSESP